MATDVKTLVVRARAEGVAGTGSALDGLAKSAKSAETSALSMFKAFFGANIAENAARKLLGVIKEAAIESVKLAAAFEVSAVKFGVMLQSTEKADVLIAQLKEFAAYTPLEYADLEQASKLLLSYGITAEEMLPTLRRLGDLAGGQAEQLMSLSRAYGQSLAQGRVQMQDMYQFINAGIPIFRALAGVMKVPQESIRELVAQGKIGFKEVQEAVKNLTDQGGQFGGMMEKVAQTAVGKYSTMTDALKMLGAAMAQSVLDDSKKVMTEVTKIADALTVAINRMRELKKIGVAREEGKPTSARAELEAASAELAQIEANMEWSVETWFTAWFANFMEDMTGYGNALRSRIRLLGDAARWEAIATQAVKDHDVALVATAKAEKERAEAAAKRQAEMATWIKTLNELWEKTPEGQRAILEASIARWEYEYERSKNYKPMIEDILEMLYKQRDAMIQITALSLQELGYIKQPEKDTSEQDRIEAARRETEAMNKKAASAIAVGDAYDLLESQYAITTASERELLEIRLLSAGATEGQIEGVLVYYDFLKKTQTEAEKAAKEQQIINDLIKKTKEDLLSMFQTYAFDFLESIGANIMGDSSSIVDSLKDIGLAILNALPQLLFYAGIKLLATPAWPVGLALILASGIVAIAAGAANEANEQAEGSAMGNVYGPRGRVTAFGAGAIVRNPTMFRFAGGLGVMGEAGEEGILPLARMPTGQLGVRSAGGSGSLFLTVNNYSGEEVTTKERTVGNDRYLELMVGAFMKKATAEGELDSAMKGRYGMRARGVSVA